MTIKKRNLKVIESTRIDFRPFHQQAIEEIEKNAYQSPYDLNKTNVINIVEPLIAFMLLRDHSNLLYTSYENTRAIRYYFGYENSLEIFDDLYLKYLDYLSDCGVSTPNYYVIEKIVDNIYLFMSVKHEEFKSLHNELYSFI